MKMLERIKKTMAKPISANGLPDKQAIAMHFEKRFGASEILPRSKANIDIRISKPTGRHPYCTLFTVGMSAYPMNAPQGFGDYRHVELMLHLPIDWSFSNSSDSLWPIEWLRAVAAYPAKSGNWLFYGQVMEASQGPAPLALKTRFRAMTLGITRLIQAGEDRDSFIMMDLGKGATVYFLTLIPLYEKEVEYRAQNSAEALFSLLDKAGVSDVIDIERPCAVTGL
jgi:hypothetical protein